MKNEKMKNWFRERSPQEKLMLALIAVLLVGIALRWAWVKKEAADAFRHRLEHFAPSTGTDSVTNPDSVANFRQMPLSPERE